MEPKIIRVLKLKEKNSNRVITIDEDQLNEFLKTGRFELLEEKKEKKVKGPEPEKWVPKDKLVIVKEEMKKKPKRVGRPRKLKVPKK